MTIQTLSPEENRQALLQRARNCRAMAANLHGEARECEQEAKILRSGLTEADELDRLNHLSRQELARRRDAKRIGRIAFESAGAVRKP